MKHKAIIVLLVLIGISTEAFAGKVKFSPLERKLITITNERRNADSLALYLADKDPNAAYRAAIGIANLEDTSVRKHVIAQISKETRPMPIDAMALALGILGENEPAFTSLLKVSEKHATNEVLTALGRTVTKNKLSVLTTYLEKGITSKQLSSKAVSRCLMELGLRKLIDSDLAEITVSLFEIPDPVTNWQAVYSFARLEDSAIIAPHVRAIGGLLQDLSSPEVRMFSAMALARCHNDEAVKLLTNAARSETEWRVNVSILNSLARSPRFSSLIFDIIKNTVTRSDVGDPTSMHIASSAFTTLDNFTTSGKLLSSDSATVRAWLDTFRPEMESHQNITTLVRAQALVVLARFGYKPEVLGALGEMHSYRERAVSSIAWEGYAILKDTFSFSRMLSRIFQLQPNEMAGPLLGLQTNWKLAKSDAEYRTLLEEARWANAYRYLTIRLPDQFDDPAVVEIAMENVQDTSIIKDETFRKEAEEYFLKYLVRYKQEQYSNQLSSVLSAVKWLKPNNAEYIEKLRSIYTTAASEWGNRPIMDSARAALKAIGSDVASELPLIIKPNLIDWKLLEDSPDTLLIQTAPDVMYLRLDKFNAPMTCLNMIRLAQLGTFIQNTFHRVVPNFVIQAGDPHQSGYGGPGYSIRREISLREYDNPCVVGMASSGKDTEGSQWFATHLPTPHLNTRYTIWGDITGGKEQVDRIQRGEKMMNIITFRAGQ